MSAFDRVGPLLRVLREPGGLRAARSWKPFSITAFQLARSLRRQGLSPDLVIDGGANVGQFARAMIETFPGAHVVSFEPLPEVAARFRGFFEWEPRVRLVETALGASVGLLSFGRNEYSLASSALPVVSGGDELVQPHLERIEVPVTTLDAALSNREITTSTLLKLDLQGFELEALRGAEATLDRVGFVLLEIALSPSYQGEPTFGSLSNHLRPFGFQFLRPLDLLRAPSSGEILQMDALFGRVVDKT
ncbi:MAG: FkbM family methyltransferase [Bacteroidota bacterium]